MENRMNRRLFLHTVFLRTIAGVALPLIGSVAARAARPVNAVASFSILADMARKVGGDRVEVAALVGPNSDAHVYEPTPGDVRTLADAAVLFVNGLGLEGWMSRLEKSSGFKGKVVTASKGVKSRQLETEAGGKGRKVADPHAWQSLANGKIYVQNIRDGLIAADPGGEATYRGNAGIFMAEIDEVEAQVISAVNALPPDHRRIITTHDAFGYFGAIGVHRSARRQHGQRGLGSGSRQDHSANQGAEDTRSVPRKHLRP
jgi:zinc/manganese transport system substrate-binding protein